MDRQRWRRSGPDTGKDEFPMPLDSTTPVPTPEYLASLSLRFFAKVNIPDDPDACQEWQGARDGDGYGSIGIGGGKVEGTHRVAWRLANGPIPPGMGVLHSCDNRPCVNLRHLFLGTQTDNMRDMAAKGRGKVMRGDDNPSRMHPERLARGHRNGAYTKPESRRKGEANGCHKLTEDRVREIRRRVATGETLASLAREFGVSDVAVHHVIKGRSWTHVT